jgi:hypothetical protein
MKRTPLFAAWGVLTACGAFAQGPIETALPPDFRASVRFHFREKLADARPGEKGVTAPAYCQEELPPAWWLPEKRRRVIGGDVPDLPFTFNLWLTRPDAQKPPRLEINVVDPRTGRSLEGFPAQRPLSRSVLECTLPGCPTKVGPLRSRTPNAFALTVQGTRALPGPTSSTDSGAWSSRFGRR